MPDTVTVRLDEDARCALDLLTADGAAISSVVRAALIAAAASQARAALRAESRALAADPLDHAEAAQVLRDMEALGAW